jgi:hypothetical protein
MRRIFTLGAVFLLASALHSAEIWTGQLFDSNCVAQHQESQKLEECTPTTKTAAFDLRVSGGMLKLDANGDLKAAAAWKEYLNSADRTIDPDFKNKPLTAVIEGTLVNGQVLKVDSILLR